WWRKGSSERASPPDKTFTLARSQIFQPPLAWAAFSRSPLLSSLALALRPLNGGAAPAVPGQETTMRWVVFGTVLALALSPAGAPWDQQQGTTPSTSSDSSTAQPATPDTSSPQSTPSTPMPPSASPPSVSPPSIPSQNTSGLQIDSKSLVGS